MVQSEMEMDQSVVVEEAAFYFYGDKSAWDVAHIIQSKAELILQE